MTLVEANDAEVTVGGRIVLSNIDLEIRQGEIVTVVGPNGSGKTTLLRTLIGAQSIGRGQVRRKPGLKVGYVPQRLDVDATLPMTVRRFLDLPRKVTDEVANRAFRTVAAEGYASRPMAELSGGQFQRALLARAILGEPDLLVLDEPTNGLDQAGSASFYELISRIRSDLGCAVLMVSHELHVVMAASDRVICLNGHVCCQGTPEHVASAPEYRALFGSGAHGALALYRHEHDHEHHHSHGVHG